MFLLRAIWFIFVAAIAIIGTVVVLLFGLMMAGITYSYAQEQPSSACMNFNQLKAALKERGKQEEISFGMVSDTVVIEIFASPAGETWTAVAVQANGTACVLATGTQWWQTTILKGDPV